MSEKHSSKYPAFKKHNTEVGGEQGHANASRDGGVGPHYDEAEDGLPRQRGGGMQAAPDIQAFGVDPEPHVIRPIDLTKEKDAGISGSDFSHHGRPHTGGGARARARRRGM